MNKFVKGLKFLSMPLFLLGLLFAGQSASAIDLSSNVYLIQGNFRSQLMTTNVNNSNCTGNSFSTNSWEDQVVCNSGYIRLYDLYISVPNRTYVNGDWIVVNLYSSAGDVSTSNHFKFNGVAYGGSNAIDLIDVEYNEVSVNSGLVKLYFRVYNTFTDSNLRLVGTNGQYGLVDVIGSGDASRQGTLRAGNTTVFHEVTDVDYSTTLNEIKDAINNSSPSADDIADAINNGEQDATQDAADAGQSAGTSAASSAQSGTSNLLGIIGQFINTLKNITPSTCTLNLDAGHLVLGNVDFCELSPPAGITALFSVIAVFFFIPLAWSTVTQIIDMFRSFTNG